MNQVWILPPSKCFNKPFAQKFMENWEISLGKPLHVWSPTYGAPQHPDASPS